METMTEPHSLTPIQFLRNCFMERKRKNSLYSLTAFARDLGLSISFLSRLMKGERPLTVKQAIQIGALIGLTPTETEQLVASVITHSSKNLKAAKYFKTPTTPALTVSHFEVERFRAISQWYHLAILNLTLTKDFNPKASSIAKRLGISRLEVEDAIDRLLELGLMERTQDSFKRTKQSLYIDSQKSERAIREFQSQMTEKSLEALKDASQESFDRRALMGSTLPIDEKDMPRLKDRLKKFQLEIAELSRSSTATDVYQFNLSLFPLTKPKTKTLE